MYTMNMRPGDPGRSRLVANTHVHLAPNFSAFETATGAVRQAAAEGIRVLGASNYYHFGIYRAFAEQAAREGIVPLFGLEIITLIEDLRRAGTLINDPTNPGRMYLCGKGIAWFDPPPPPADVLAGEMRAANDARMREMVLRMNERFTSVGLANGITDELIALDVAARSGVPRPWVSLQERHVARAFQESFFRQVPEPARDRALARILGTGAASAVGADDPVGVQELMRSHLMKAGKPAFVPEAAVTFDDAYRLILELGGIPCYPTLADGASPICGFEDPPETLADELLDRGIYCAELIPVRNSGDAVDRYVAAFRSRGIVVTAGTEHNTQQPIPFMPACRDDQPLSELALEAFWEGTCVVVAHQHRVISGEPGYVDRHGRPNADFAGSEDRIRAFREQGAELIGASRAPAAELVGAGSGE